MKPLPQLTSAPWSRRSLAILISPRPDTTWRAVEPRSLALTSAPCSSSVVAAAISPNKQASTKLLFKASFDDGLTVSLYRTRRLLEAWQQAIECGLWLPTLGAAVAPSLSQQGVHNAKTSSWPCVPAVAVDVRRQTVGSR